jgi:hypothetical protein
VPELKILNVLFVFAAWTFGRQNSQAKTRQANTHPPKANGRWASRERNAGIGEVEVFIIFISLSRFVSEQGGEIEGVELRSQRSQCFIALKV